MRFLVFLLLVPPAALAQEQPHELLGKVGTRPALLILHAAQRPDGSAQVAGEYVVLPTLARRFVEGERSPELGVTVLKEGSTPILFGRPPSAELHGTWRDGVYKGTRFGPGRQPREEFEFTEEFPALDNLTTSVRCESKEARYQSRLSLAIEKGVLKNLEWRVTEPGGQACTVSGAEQKPMRGGLRFLAGACRLTLRDTGDLLALRAENCAAQCEADAHLGWLFIDKRGNCELLP